MNFKCLTGGKRTTITARFDPDGKVESDQQYRGFRWWNQGGGSRTSNNHFTRDVLRADGTKAYVGYGVDSLTVGLVAICRVKFAGETRDAVASLYPTAEEACLTRAVGDAWCSPAAGLVRVFEVLLVFERFLVRNRQRLTFSVWKPTWFLGWDAGLH